MVSWQIARRPIRQAGPVLLVVVATATTTLALAGYASWRQSAADQAAFAVGSDVRVDAAAGLPLGATGAITGAPGVTAATPASIASIGNGGQLIALDASTAGQAILLRPDLSPLPLSALWRRITPRRPSGLALPGQPDRLEILAALGAGPRTSAAEVRRELGSATVTAWIQEADGATLPGTRRGAARRRPAARPGRHAARSAAGQLPAAAARALADLCPAAVRPGEPAAGPDRPASASSPSRWPGRPAARSASRSATVPPWRRGRARDRRRTCRPGRRARSRRCRHRTAHRRRSCAGMAPPGAPSSSRSTPDTIRRCRSCSDELLDPGTATGQVAITARPPSPVVPVIATSGYLTASRLGVRIDRLGLARRILGPGPDRGLGGRLPDCLRAEPGADRRPRGGQRRARRRPGRARAGDPLVAAYRVAAGYRTCRTRPVRRRPRPPAGGPARTTRC